MASIRTGVLSSVAVCATGFVVPVLAEEARPLPATGATSNELEEVIVTAERRKSDIQSIAASVSVRTGEALAAQGRYTTRQILEDVPGVVVVDNSSVNVGSADVQGNNITIRGITPGASAGGGPMPIRRGRGRAAS